MIIVQWCKFSIQGTQKKSSSRHRASFRFMKFKWTVNKIWFHQNLRSIRTCDFFLHFQRSRLSARVEFFLPICSLEWMSFSRFQISRDARRPIPQTGVNQILCKCQHLMFCLIKIAGLLATRAKLTEFQWTHTINVKYSRDIECTGESGKSRGVHFMYSFADISSAASSYYVTRFILPFGNLCAHHRNRRRDAMAWQLTDLPFLPAFQISILSAAYGSNEKHNRRNTL